MIRKITEKQVLKEIEMNKNKLKEPKVSEIGLFGSVLKRKSDYVKKEAKYIRI